MENKIIEIKKQLLSYPVEVVKKYCAYLDELSKVMHKVKETGKYEKTHPFVEVAKVDWLCNHFIKLFAQGLEFDGKHITLQKRGVSLDYIAMKNKLLEVYPEAKILFSVVRKDDLVNFSQENGVVNYYHQIGSPFEKKDIIGAWCVLKCSRGEYITVLDKAEIDKHKNIATTKNIWATWFEEMALKTVIRKACRIALDDVVGGIDEVDIDAKADFTQLDQKPVADVVQNARGEIQQKVDSCATVAELGILYKELGITGQEAKIFTTRKLEILGAQNANS